MQLKTVRYWYRYWPEGAKNVQGIIIANQFIAILYNILIVYNYGMAYGQVIESDELKLKANLSFPHTSHCLGNGQIMVSAMGDVDGNAKGMEF